MVPTPPIVTGWDLAQSTLGKNEGASRTPFADSIPEVLDEECVRKVQLVPLLACHSHVFQALADEVTVYVNVATIACMPQRVCVEKCCSSAAATVSSTAFKAGKKG